MKTTHHRARRAMAAYDRQRCVPRRELQDRTRAALERFMTAIVSDDVPAVEAMLAESVRAYSDGGGEYFAARVPVVGRAKVARFFCNIARRRGEIAGATFRMMNGLPALVTEFAHEATGEARWFVTRLDVDAEGRITALHSVLASRKLTAARGTPGSAATTLL